MIMPDVVDAQLCQYLSRDAMIPSVVASDPDPNTPPVETLEQPHALSSYNPAFQAIEKQRE